MVLIDNKGSMYTDDRLLTPKGGWLELIRSGNHSKLARVTIDFPNNADSSWSLDIKKTSATIPYKFREEIKINKCNKSCFYSKNK